MANAKHNCQFERRTRRINFDAQSVSDEFNGTSLGSQWQWLRENPTTHSLTSKQVGDVIVDINK